MLQVGTHQLRKFSLEAPKPYPKEKHQTSDFTSLLSPSQIDTFFLNHISSFKI